MSALLKFGIAVGLLIALASLISAVIPDTFTGLVYDNLVYFLTQIGVVGHIIPVETAFACMRIILNFMLGVTLFIFFRWFLHMFSR